MNKAAQVSSAGWPLAPKRSHSAKDWSMYLGTAVLLYLAGVVAAGGNVFGLAAAGVAALAIVTLQARRIGQPPVNSRESQWGNYGAIAVAVGGLLWSVNLWQFDSVEGVWRYVWPAVPVVLYIVFVVVMFARRVARRPT